jgi:hypothetical protein
MGVSYFALDGYFHNRLQLSFDLSNEFVALVWGNPLGTLRPSVERPLSDVD